MSANPDDTPSGPKVCAVKSCKRLTFTAFCDYHRARDISKRRTEWQEAREVRDSIRDLSEGEPE